MQYLARQVNTKLNSLTIRLHADQLEDHGDKQGIRAANGKFPYPNAVK